MASGILTERERRDRQLFIDAALERNPAAGRAAAIREGEGTWREWRGGFGGAREARPAVNQAALTEAVATAVRTVTAARKAAKRAARRATAEAAASRVLQERRQLEARFTETAIGRSLREAAADDLAAIAAIGMSGAGQAGPAARPVVEMAVRPEALSLEELGVAATVGSAGGSAFWTGQTAGRSPFWRGLQNSGASKGSADAQ